MKPKNANIILFILLVVFFIITPSCNDEDRIPYVYVDYRLHLNNPELIDLQTPGNYVYLTGGVRGIIVYCVYAGSYNAYERNCPYKPNSDNAYLMVDSTETRLVCKSCDSKFSLFDGTLLEGPSIYPVLQYNTFVQNDILYIYNDFY